MWSEKRLIFAVLVISIPLWIVSNSHADIPRSANEVFQIISSTNPTDVGRALAALPAETFRNFSLVTHSESRQSGAFDKPRVILFNPSGGFYLTFTSARAERRADEIEMITFNPDTRAFEFDAIEFKGHRARRLSRDETKSCLGCHSSDGTLATAHPIWDTYPDWPGVYGAFHIRAASDPLLTPAVQNHFDNFKRIFARDDRFRNLTRLKSQDLTSLAQMNVNLGDIIAADIHRKAAHLISSAPGFPRFAPALSGIFGYSNAPTFEKALTDPELAEFDAVRTKLDEQCKQGQARYMATKIGKFNNYAKLTPPPTCDPDTVNDYTGFFDNFDDGDIEQRVKLNFVLAKLGLNPEILNMTLRKKTFSSAQGNRNLSDLIQRLERDHVSCASSLSKGSPRSN